MPPADEQAKLKKRLEAVLKLVDNQVCADCRRRGPRWASANLGVFVCIECSGIHRNLGVHVSFVRSVNLDTWTQKQVDYMEEWGNGRANQYYEANIPSHVTRPKEGDPVRVVEKFIRDKYEYKRYTSESMPPKQSSSQSTSNGGSGTTAVEGGGVDGVKRMNGSTALARGEAQVVIRQRPVSNLSKPSAASAAVVAKPVAAVEAPSLIDFDFAPTVPSAVVVSSSASALPTHAPPPVPTMDPFFAPSNATSQQSQSQFQQQHHPQQQQQQQHDPFGMQQAPMTWTSANTQMPAASNPAPATVPAAATMQQQPSKASANDILSLFASPTNTTSTGGAPVTTGGAPGGSMYGGGLNAISAMGSPMAGQGHNGFPLQMGGMMGGGVHMMGSPPPVPMQQHQMMMMQQQQQQHMNAGIRQQPMPMMNMGPGPGPLGGGGGGGGHGMMGGTMGGHMMPQQQQQQPPMMSQPMMGGMNNGMQQPQQPQGFPQQHMGGGGMMMMGGGGMGGGMVNPNQGFPPQHAPPMPHPMQQQQQQGMQGFGQGMMQQQQQQQYQMNKPFG